VPDLDIASELDRIWEFLAQLDERQKAQSRQRVRDRKWAEERFRRMSVKLKLIDAVIRATPNGIRRKP